MSTWYALSTSLGVVSLLCEAPLPDDTIIVLAACCCGTPLAALSFGATTKKAGRTFASFTLDTYHSHCTHLLLSFLTPQSSLLTLWCVFCFWLFLHAVYHYCSWSFANQLGSRCCPRASSWTALCWVSYSSTCSRGGVRLIPAASSQCPCTDWAEEHQVQSMMRPGSQRIADELS